jgi:hypothetical protein
VLVDKKLVLFKGQIPRAWDSSANKKRPILSELELFILFYLKAIPARDGNNLKDMVTLLKKLDLPFIWVTPTGVEINQRYIKFDKRKVKHALYKNAPTYTCNTLRMIRI